MNKRLRLSVGGLAVTGLLALSAAPAGAQDEVVYEDIECVPEGLPIPQIVDFTFSAVDGGPVEPGEQFVLEDLTIVADAISGAGGDEAETTLFVNGVESDPINLGFATPDQPATWGPLDVTLTAPNQTGTFDITPGHFTVFQFFAMHCPEFPDVAFATVEVALPPDPPEPGPPRPRRPSRT